MVIKRNPRVVSKKVGTKWIILEPNKRFVRTLNPTAGFIWTLTATPTSIGEIAHKVAKHFKIQTKEAQRDVENFLNRYVREGLLMDK